MRQIELAKKIAGNNHAAIVQEMINAMKNVQENVTAAEDPNIKEMIRLQKEADDAYLKEDLRLKKEAEDLEKARLKEVARLNNEPMDKKSTEEQHQLEQVNEDSLKS